MCAICVEGEKSIKALKKPNINKILKKQLKKQVSLYKIHKKEFVHQRKTFNLQKESLKKGQVLLVLDFKENVKINQCPVDQISSEFYSSYQRTVFGIVMYYFDEDSLQIQKCFYDIFSDNTKHNSLFVIKASRLLNTQQSFLKHNYSDINIWMDNSPNQFKTKELFSYLCKLPVFYDNVQWNFFIEYHGKSPYDTRFSQISNMLKLYVMNINNPLIQNTQELIQAISNQQKDQKNFL